MCVFVCEVYTVVIHVMLAQIPEGKLTSGERVGGSSSPVLWPGASGLRESVADCTGEAEAVVLRN